MNDAIKAQTKKQGCKEIFGTEHPADVIGPLDTASETLFQLESLFDAIAADPKATIHIQRLSAIGAYLAASIGNYADVQHEAFRDAVKNGGAA